MTLDHEDLDDRLREMRRVHKDDPAKGYAAAMEYLKTFLDQPLSSNDRESIYHSIALEQGLYRQLDDEEQTAIAITKQFPHSALGWIHASAFYCWTRQDGSKAKDLALRAVEAAYSSGEFVTHALNTLCRAAKLCEDYPLLSRSIEAILRHTHVKGTIDCAHECDFLINLPPGAVDSALISRLNELCAKVPRRR
jgi:hypothetical protein